MNKFTFEFTVFNDLPFLKAISTTRLFSANTENLTDKPSRDRFFMDNLSVLAGINPESIFWPNQVHGDEIAILGKGEKSEKLSKIRADSIITAEHGAMIGVFTADCCPIILASQDGKAVGAVHSGWKGTLLRNIEKTIGKMCREYSIKPQSLRAAIGPSIGSCCYSVPKSRLNLFTKEFDGRNQFIYSKNNRDFIDLKGLNKSMLLAAGLKKENVEVSNICTSCELQRCYSYRRDGTPVMMGRHFTGIMLI
jgi:polyphenol oxidase